MDHVEQGLILAISGGDHESRFVYMDWLEEHEAYDRLEYMRIDEVVHDLPIHDPAYIVTHARHRQLEQLHEAWCGQVGRAHVRARLQIRDRLLSVEDPSTLEKLVVLATRARAPKVEIPPFQLPVQLRYLEELNARANR